MQLRVIDLHCYPNTQPWITAQGPYVEVLATYWGRAWVPKTEDEVTAELKAASGEPVLVAFDIETVAGTPPCANEYVAQMRDNHPDLIRLAWAAVDPFKGETAIQQARTAIQDLKMLGFHFHPIMGHYSVDDERLYPLWETINALKVPVMIDVGTTGMGAGLPGGLGAKIRHAHPSAIDSWELSGWAPKYFPDSLKRDIRNRLQDKIMFGSDYLSIPHEQLFREWNELGYSDALMEKIFHQNAERIVGL